MKKTKVKLSKFRCGACDKLKPADDAICLSVELTQFILEDTNDEQIDVCQKCAIKVIIQWLEQR